MRSEPMGFEWCSVSFPSRHERRAGGCAHRLHAIGVGVAIGIGIDLSGIVAAW